MCNFPKGRTLSTSNPPLPSVVWGFHHVKCFVDILYFPSRSAKISIAEHWSFYVALTLLWGDMLDVSRFRPRGDKLGSLCQCWYVWSTWTKQNQCFVCDKKGNSDSYRTTWLNSYRQFHVISRRFFETNIFRHPIPQSMSSLYLTMVRFRLSYTTIYTCKQTHNIGRTYCKLCDCGKLLQLAAICSSIHLE